jgi:hypothetical protein
VALKSYYLEPQVHLDPSYKGCAVNALTPGFQGVRAVLEGRPSRRYTSGTWEAESRPWK